MRSRSVCIGFSGIVSLLAALSGCAEGADDPSEPEVVQSFPSALPEPAASTPEKPMPEPLRPSVPDADGEVQNPNLPIAVEEPAGGSSPPLSGGGLLVNGTCVPVCASNASDADAMGVTDGWGWENEKSCLVSGSMVASQGMACELVPLNPEPPYVVPDGNVTRPEGTDSAGFFVSGGRLYDRRGNDFVMRGVNNPLAWFRNRNTGALAWLAQIASTGANTVRLVWETNVPDTQLLRDTVARTVELRMVPMIEMHDVTGGTSADGPASMARYLTETAAVKQILLDYEDSLLVNIANEWSGANNIYVQAYTDAINVFRNAGIRHTLVIDSNGYGQNANTVLTQAQALLAADPQHNLLFSVHMYEQFRNAQTIRDTLQRALDNQVPFIVGEFGFQHGSDAQGNPFAIPYDVLLSESVRLGLGYLAWSWTGNGGGVEYLDLTARSGSVNELSVWGDGVINGENGIRATAEPASIFLE
jgi:mannan endo-1,4-beta-mannosidase